MYTGTEPALPDSPRPSHWSIRARRRLRRDLGAAEPASANPASPRPRNPLRRAGGAVAAACTLLLLGMVPASADGPRVGWSPADAPAGRCSHGSTMNIVAHEDDDLLFLSPDLIHDIRSGRCVRTVFITAGDASERIAGTVDQRRQYWMAREAGSRAAYALMTGVRNAWRQSHSTINGHHFVVYTLIADPKISEVFLRLPDGNPDGSGSRFHNKESLLKLRVGQIRTIHAIDGSATYTKAGLLATVTGLVEQFHPKVIRTQDYVALDYAPGFDHADHTLTADLAHAASEAYRAPHQLVGYLDYDISLRPANLSGRDLAVKQAAFYRYDQFDSQLPCYTAALRKKNGVCSEYAAWLVRSYRAATGPGWYQPCFVPELAGFPIALGQAPASEDEATALIRGNGCAVGKVTHEFDNGVPDGFVLEQSPQSDDVFRLQGTKVNLVISDGPEPASTPKP